MKTNRREKHKYNWGDKNTETQRKLQGTLSCRSDLLKLYKPQNVDLNPVGINTQYTLGYI